MADREYGRHYIIVVHGIGDQKLSETTTPVVLRFAEQREKLRSGNEVDYRYVVPSNLSSQSVRAGGMGHGWSEFKGIPIDPDQRGERFDGTRDGSGENFRFVDLLWADILRKDQSRFAVPVEQWAPAVLNRIDRDDGIMPADWVPAWAERMLGGVVEAGISIKRTLALKFPELAKTIFDDFLGDVHLYGDYTRTRGWAVRHFHTVLDEICLRDFFDWASKRIDRKEALEGYLPPRFTVIAHSLGSIMSFDALTYAFANEERVRGRSRRAKPECPSLPFAGYTYPPEIERKMWQTLAEEWEALLKKAMDAGQYNLEGKLSDAYPALERAAADALAEAPHHPRCLWREGVRNFVTLGSPVDKYHVLWAPNYRHLGLRLEEGGEFGDDLPFSADWFDRPARPIVHYNLCDEQDPVGHHLDVARRTDAYPLIFNTNEKEIPTDLRDVVFRRYPVPGKAHVDYWGDRELFEGIVGEVIDERSVGEGDARAHVDTGDPLPEGRGFFLSRKFNEEEERIYDKALSWSYAKIPFFTALITAVLLAYGLNGIFDPDDPVKMDLSRSLAVVAAVLLWVRPAFLRAYRRSEGKGDREKRLWHHFFARGVFALLVSMAVEWRLIVVKLAGGGGKRAVKPPPTTLSFLGVMALTAAVSVLFNLLPKEWLHPNLHPLLDAEAFWQSPPFAVALALFGAGVLLWDRWASKRNAAAAHEKMRDEGRERRRLPSSGRLVARMYLWRPLAPLAALAAWFSWDALCTESVKLPDWLAFGLEVVLFTSLIYLAAILYALMVFDFVRKKLNREA